MPRPKKEGVDYFPHYCNHGKTMKILEAKFGNDGYALWFKLLEQLGRASHHYYDCRNVELWEFLQAETRLNEDTICKILDLLSKLDAIDADLWKEKIVWCQKLVDGIAGVYGNRRVEIPTKPNIYGSKPQEDVPKQPKKSVTTSKSTHSRVENSRGEREETPHTLKEEIFSFFKTKFGGGFSNDQIEQSADRFILLKNPEQLNGSWQKQAEAWMKLEKPQKEPESVEPSRKREKL